ncbi:hypothetical protein [Campylobacter troglodytis]|uniref:hypothetical protein n=1 Tax=Campylobacter troglodytis TaxID=654363 RepID=UPI00115BABF5|nr:hypothetical protein [Campylobacter troglodytis]TQR61188.1 hypothetical protein DMC01_02660 [Campylobacter troglodytis]
MSDFAQQGALPLENSTLQGKGALQGEVSARNDDTSKLEQEINKLVYSLYDLNESEIKLIESK